MASLTIPFPSLQLYNSSNRRLPSTRRFHLRPIRASVSSESPPVSATPAPEIPPVKLPIKKIPGNYGLPIIGPILDRQGYFYGDGGRNEWFRSKVQKHKSTVFRSNMPPGPSISSNSKVIVLLDGKSFPVLFDNTKVEKKDLFTGTYMPSVELTGGYRVLSYLDPSEPSHAKLKSFMFYLLKQSSKKVIPEFHNSFTEMFESLEDDLAKNGKAAFAPANDQASFNFLARSLYGVNPSDTKLGSDGPKIIAKWVLIQLGPILTLGLPKYIEEILLHTFRLPPILIKRDYSRLYDFFFESSSNLLDEAFKMGIGKEEACHNLIFATCFNSFGGMKILFPNMMKWIGRAGVSLHTRLADEIRSVTRSNRGEITMRSIEQMPLMKSVVYESFRIEPPVPLQYGKAKRDFTIESHDAVFEVKEGEMLFGYQPFATKDPKIFDRAEEFVPDRFIGDGEELLKHVLWSNGPENESPTLSNKQCAGKDYVVMVARLLLVEFFLRYDSFEIEVANSALGANVTVKSLKRATY